MTAEPLRGAGFATQVWVLTVHALRATFTDYRLVCFGLLQPVVILVLFSQVFQSVGSLPAVAGFGGYTNYLVPATMVNIAVSAAMGSGMAFLGALHTGVIGRMRRMPMRLFAVLAARTLADTARVAVPLVVTVVAAVLVLGFAPAGGVLGTVAAAALTLFVGWGLSWVFLAIAVWARKPETVQVVSFLVMFPLMFASSAYVPVTLLPGWIRWFSAVNPLTYAVDATRGLALGGSLAAVPAALALTAALTALAASAAARSFRRS